MPYVVNNTRGQIIAVIADGTINTSATSQTLVGKNVTPYGEYEVENLVHQLENFANSTPPGNPIEGQLWYNTTDETLYTFSGEEWKPTSGLTVSTSQPVLDPRNGDLWFDPNTQQVKVFSPVTTGTAWVPVSKVTVSATAPATVAAGELYWNSDTEQLWASDGTSWNLIGPEAVAGFGVTRCLSTVLLDTDSVQHAVILGQVDGVTQCVISSDTFTILESVRPTGFENIVPGINLADGSIVNGRVLSADRLTFPRNINGVPFDGTANITIGNPGGLTAGNYLLGTEYFGTVPQTFDVDASPANLANKVVARDALGDFSARVVTASLVGNVTGIATNVSGLVQPANGGTGQSFYNPGDILVGRSGGGLSRGQVKGSEYITIDSSDGNITVNFTGGAGIGTVTSIGISTVGEGIGIAGSPVTGSGDILVTNTGVTRLTAGRGITTDAVNGSVTVTNDGVTRILAGDNVQINAEKGDVTISASGGSGGTVNATPELAGSIKLWAGTTVPTGWRACDGSAISRSQYSILFSRIGTTYGAGDGSTTFNLPDFRGKTALGTSSSYALGSTGGSADAVVVSHDHSITLTTQEAGEHFHRQGSEALYNNYGGGNFVGPRTYPEGDIDSYNDQNTSTIAAHTHTLFGDTDSTGESGSGKNLPPYTTVYWIIKVDDSTVGGGVTKIIAGEGVTVSPVDGTGAVTITAVGGGGGGVELAGSIKLWAGATAPAGWHICDGSAVSRVTYSTLFARIGITYGTGDGINTFNLPDFRDRTAFGVSLSKTRGSTGGSADAVIVSHSHTFDTTTSSAGAHSHEIRSGAGGSGTDPLYADGRNGLAGMNVNGPYNLYSTSNPMLKEAGAHTHDFDGTTATAGVSGTGKNLPPYLSVYWIIKMDDSVTSGAATGGTVTEITAGDGLEVDNYSGSSITGSGTMSVDDSVLRTMGTQTITGRKIFDIGSGQGGPVSAAYGYDNAAQYITLLDTFTHPSEPAILVMPKLTPSAHFLPERFFVRGNSTSSSVWDGFGGVITGIENGTAGGAGVHGTVTTNVAGLGVGVLAGATSGTFTGAVSQNVAVRPKSSSFIFFRCYAGNNDPVFYIRGDGQVFADGNYQSGGADYAEYFEWEDQNLNNEDRVGMTVSLIGNKIVVAQEGDTVLGVISANPTVIGDAAEAAWQDKWLRDDFKRTLTEPYHVWAWDEPILDRHGAIIDTQTKTINSFDVTPSTVIPENAVKKTHDEAGNKLVRPVLNPSYNESQVYVPRSQRPEWDAVGLMGKLRLRKGQVVGANWIKLRDISATVEEWLVR